MSVLSILVLNFFRDPERPVPAEPHAIISPADGLIVQLAEEEFESRPVRRLSIFMSPLDVHVNRTPIAGTIKAINYKKGSFRVASKELASIENEQNVFTVEGEQGVVVVKQIAGLLARRIVFWKRLRRFAGAWRARGNDQVRFACRRAGGPHGRVARQGWRPRAGREQHPWNHNPPSRLSAAASAGASMFSPAFLRWARWSAATTPFFPPSAPGNFWPPRLPPAWLRKRRSFSALAAVALDNASKAHRLGHCVRWPRWPHRPHDQHRLSLRARARFPGRCRRLRCGAGGTGLCLGSARRWESGRHTQLIQHLREIAWILTFAYVICGAARLARFNIDTVKPTSDRRFFVGMPIPAGAGFVAAVVHFYKQPLTSWQFSLAWLVMVGILGFLMVSRMRYYSFKTLDLRKRRSYLGIIVIGLIIGGHLALLRARPADHRAHLRDFRHRPADHLQDSAPPACTRRGPRRMKPGKEGYRIAVVGASSLLGKELVAILEQGKFPVSRLLTFEADEDEPELPIIDLNAASAAVVEDGQINEAELDFAFLAARLRQLPAFLTSWQQQGSAARCLVIDVVGRRIGDGVGRFRLAAEPTPTIWWASLFSTAAYPVAGVHTAAGRIHVSAHPAVIVISSLLLRLAARFPLKTAVAQVFSSASESGSRGVEELQRQTVNILSFQKVPDKIFGAQLAFNLLSRLGRSGKGEMAAPGNPPAPAVAPLSGRPRPRPRAAAAHRSGFLFRGRLPLC